MDQGDTVIRSKMAFLSTRENHSGFGKKLGGTSYEIPLFENLVDGRAFRGAGLPVSPGLCSGLGGFLKSGAV